MSPTTVLTFRGVELNIGWAPGEGRAIPDLPTAPGIYAEINWAARGVRIGETGNSIRGKIRHDVAWFEAMHRGTAPVEQLRRPHPICLAARKYGAVGFEFFVVSYDPRLVDKALRQDAERFMFSWVAGQPQYTNWNRQVSWR